MPVLPRAEDLGHAQFQPQKGVVSMQTGQVGQALVQAGQVGRRTAERALNFIDDTASLHARAAVVELKRAQNQLAIGEGGYAHLKNGAATTPGVIEDYQTRFNDQVQALGANLSPEARQKFDGMAREQGTHFQAGVLNHVMRQDESHRGEVYQAQIGVASETMGLNFNNPAAILRERANIETTVAGFAQKNGIKDKALLERMLQDARGAGHEAVINGYLTAGQAGQAQEYFEVIRKNGGEMTPQKAKSIENMLKPEVAFETGRAIASELFALEVGGATSSEIEAEKLRLTKGTSREVVAAVDKAFSDQVSARDDDRKDSGGEILLDFIEGKGGSGPGDHRLRAIRSADPTHAVSLVLQMEQIGRRRAAAAGSDKASMPSMQAYGIMAERIAVGEADINDVLSLAGQVTNQHLKELMAQVRSQDKAAANAKIDTAMINAGIPPSAKSTNDKNAYKGFVHSQFQRWKEQNPGKVPTEDEKKSIVSSASVEHTDTTRWWSDSVKAFEAKADVTFPSSFKETAPGANKQQLLKQYLLMKEALPGRSDSDLDSAFGFLRAARVKERQQPPGTPPVADATLLKMWDEDN